METTPRSDQTPKYTDEQIEAGVLEALVERNFEAVGGLIAMLALQNPRRADDVRRTILYGLKVGLKLTEGGA